MADSNTICVFETECSHEVDTLSQLPDDVSCKVTSFLDAHTLCKMRLVNRKFKAKASKNSAGWDHLCRNLWKEKVHVSREAQQELQCLSATLNVGKNESCDENAMSAYRKSVLDGRHRQNITREELIFDPDTETGTIWSFRFKEAAGLDWTSSDPWFNNQSCRKMVFLENGSVKWYIPTECTSRSNQQGVLGGRADATNDMDLDGSQSTETKSENRNGRPLLVDPQYTGFQPDGSDNDGHVQDPPVTVTWRFVNQPLDFPDRPMGSYIRFSLRGREVPTYVCRRSPNGNWGFILESCWGVYASFDLPPRPPNFSSGLRRRPFKRRLRRSLNLQQGREIHFQVDVEDSSDDEEQEEPSGDDALIYDCYFNVTTELQWREVFLYNNFALPILPEVSGV